MPKVRNRPLPELQEAARVATQIALAGRPKIPEGVSLTLGTLWDGDSVVFELYVAQERPQDAIILTEARVNAIDGRVQSVRIFEDAIRGLKDAAA